MPTVSVILSTYNRAHLLPRSISSVLCQTYRSLELIIVVDGSTDGTQAFLASQTDPRIRIFYRDHQLSVNAVNFGISQAEGEFLAFIDDDDEWTLDKLELQMAAFAEAPANVGVIFSRATAIPPQGKPYAMHAPQLPSGSIRSELLRRGCFVCLVTAVVRKHCFQEVGVFDTCLLSGNEWDLWIRMADKFEFLYLPKEVAIVYLTPGGISRSEKNIRATYAAIAARYQNEMQNHAPHNLAYLRCRASSSLILSGQFAQGWELLQQAFRAPTPSLWQTFSLWCTCGVRLLYRRWTGRITA